MLENKKTLILLIVIGFIAFIVILVKLFYVPTQLPTQNFYTKSGPNVDVVPTVQPDQFGNGGLDINSPIVKESQRNVDLIRNKLPFKDSFKSTSGLQVSVFIAKVQTVPWELDIQVNGVNYLKESTDPDYNKDKTA